MPSPETVVTILSFFTIFGDIVVLLLLIATLAQVLGVRKKACALSRPIDRYGLPLLFLIPLLASIGSLYFSEIALWTPCKECWFQRIFMYSQVPIVLVALLRRDTSVAVPVLTLSLIGMVFAIKQYVSQVLNILMPSLTGTCGDAANPCSSTQIFQFGYITIPMMALTAFALSALVAWRMIRSLKEGLA
jgi:disulfide bond formation protein DsbB